MQPNETFGRQRFHTDAWAYSDPCAPAAHRRLPICATGIRRCLRLRRHTRPIQGPDIPASPTRGALRASISKTMKTAPPATSTRMPPAGGRRARTLPTRWGTYTVGAFSIGDPPTHIGSIEYHPRHTHHQSGGPSRHLHRRTDAQHPLDGGQRAGVAADLSFDMHC